MHVKMSYLNSFSTQVANLEGRAGMTAIVDPEKEVDMSKLHSSITKYLPSYAQPIFVRIVGSIDTTGGNFNRTMKIGKQTQASNCVWRIQLRTQ